MYGGGPAQPPYAAPAGPGQAAPPPYAAPAGYPGAPGQPHYVVPAPPAVSPAGQPLASFVDRLVACLVDGVILGLVGLLIGLPAAFLFFGTVGVDLLSVETRPDGTVDADPGPFLLALFGFYAGLFVFSLILAYVYYVELTLRRGQTVGKRVMKIKIVPLDPAGSITRGVLVKRYGTQWLCGLVPGMVYVDGLWQLWDKPYQQCLHDKVAKTVVVKVPA